MTGPTLEATNLTKQFGSFTAVHQLNLRVEGAKCVGFLGPNGAGKTTTLKMFTNFIHPTAGTARINGVDVMEDKRRALEECGSLIETPEIYPALTPREALSYIADLRGIPSRDRTRRIKEVLDEVRMTEWIDARTGKFSKGMKQRVNIAAALLPDPQILLLDEPSTGLDPRGVAEVRDIVLALKRQQRLIFMSSHLLGEVSDMCDEVAMIDHGQLLAYDTIENVTNRVVGEADLVEIGLAAAADGNLEARLGAIPGVTLVTRTDARKFTLRFRGGPAGQQKLLADLVNAQIGLLSFTPATSMARLEDTYLKLIQGGY